MARKNMAQQSALWMTIENSIEEKKIIKKAFETIRNDDFEQLDESDPNHQDKLKALNQIILVVFPTLNRNEQLRYASRSVISEIDVELNIRDERITNYVTHLLPLTRPKLKYNGSKNLVPYVLTTMPKDYLKYLAHVDFDQEGQFTGYLVTRALFYQKSPQELMDEYGLHLYYNWTGKSLQGLEKEGIKLFNGHKVISLKVNSVNSHADYAIFTINSINVDQPEKATCCISYRGYANQKLVGKDKIKCKSIVYETWLIKYDEHSSSMRAIMGCRSPFEFQLFSKE